jgi:hypothetical protein
MRFGEPLTSRRIHMVTALCKVYNSERMGLKKCLDSLNGIESIILCDGRYPDSAWGTSDPGQLEYFRKRYPPGNESTDNSREIAKAYSNILWLKPPEQGWTSETEKMNYALKYIPDDNWVLLIDPDETLVGRIETAFPPSQCDVIGMRVVDMEGHSLYYYRLFKKKKGVSFATHHSLFLEQGGIIELYAGNSADYCFIRHNRIEVS